MLCPVDEINYLSGPGKGVILIKLKPGEDRVLGFVASKGDRDLLTVETSRGARADHQHREVRGDRAAAARAANCCSAASSRACVRAPARRDLPPPRRPPTPRPAILRAMMPTRRASWDVLGIGANSIDFVTVVPAFPRPEGWYSKMQIRRHLVTLRRSDGDGDGGLRALRPARALHRRSRLGRERRSGCWHDLPRHGVDASGVVAREGRNQFAVIVIDGQTGERAVLVGPRPQAGTARGRRSARRDRGGARAARGRRGPGRGDPRGPATRGASAFPSRAISIA